MEEEWKEIIGYEGKYSVSNMGRIKVIKKGTFLSPGVNKRGYEQVVLTINRVSKTKSVHRLVANAFIPNPDNKPQVNHLNFDTRNNCVDNLEWATALENVRHSRANRPIRRSYFLGKTGGLHPKSKKVCMVDKKGNILKEFEGVREAARIMNVAYGTIRYGCLHPYKWKLKFDVTRKYYWKYLD